MAATIEELREALGLLSTLAPKVVMDPENPVEMAKEIELYVTGRLNKLDALEAAGVDNWEGYDDAVSPFIVEDDSEDEDETD
jgi:hypothetical protein